MSELLDCKKIVDDMSVRHDMYFTELERTLLETAVLHGAMAMLDNERAVMKELREKLHLISDEPKEHWIHKIFKRKK